VAGIGFVLRKLYRRDNLSGLVQAYAHSAMASTGPWLFTVLSLAIIIMITNRFMGQAVLFDFRVIIIYNFCFSLVLSGPLFMVVTRYLADCIHRKDVSTVPGTLVGSMLLLYLYQLPMVAAFYFLYAKLSMDMAVGAIVNFLLISGIWLLSVFLTALKDYTSITWAYGIGMLAAVGATIGLAGTYSAVGMLYGFSAGLALITAVLVAGILAQYPYPFRHPFAFLPCFKQYWELALSGVIYNVAVWVDKWIMWFSPESEVMRSGLRIYPDYDSAMFIAYLTIVPSMAMFLFSIETNFFEHYLRFYRDIQNKVTLHKVQKNHRALMGSIFGSARNFLIMQASLCVMAIIMAPRILSVLGGNYLQIGIFRFGTLGALCHVLTMFLLILLSYFDNRKGALLIQVVFLVCNAAFTWLIMHLGFQYYGYGYFISSLITLIVAGIISVRYILNLPYHTFITTNLSIR
jgi:polysaccharide biosynthesis protein PelG